MAITIKSIPVLEGAAAERFNEMADANKRQETTIVPKETLDAIERMLERSRKFQLKTSK